jgi:hypothetical protein
MNVFREAKLFPCILRKSNLKNRCKFKKRHSLNQLSRVSRKMKMSYKRSNLISQKIHSTPTKI